MGRTMIDVGDPEFLDRQIASAEDLIARQQRLVERLRGRGETSVQAEKLLATLREALQRFRSEREALAKIGASKPPH